MKTIAVMAAVAMMTGIAAAQTPNVPLAPSGKWFVDFADEQCSMTRTFGTAPAGPVTIGFKPQVMDDTTSIVVIVPNGVATYPRPKPAKPDTARIIALPSATPIAIESVRSGTTAQKERAAFITIKRSALPVLEAASAIAIEAGDFAVTIAPATLASAIRALGKCEADQATRLGIDPHESDEVATPAEAVGDQGAWILPDDYPGDAIRSERHGTTIILWTIAADGRVMDCRPVVSSGTPSLDAAACSAITRRGRYRPAIGKDGRPMVTHSARPVYWTMPSR